MQESPLIFEKLDQRVEAVGFLGGVPHVAVLFCCVHRVEVGDLLRFGVHQCQNPVSIQDVDWDDQQIFREGVELLRVESGASSPLCPNAMPDYRIVEIRIEDMDLYALVLK